MRTKLSVAFASVVLIAACGGSDDSTSGDTDAPTTVAADTTVADPTTTVASGEVVNADPVLVDLSGDFVIGVDTITYKAGTINFLATNASDTPHEFGIARGNSYEELPLLANGSIDEDALGDDFLGKTPVVDQILSPEREISFDLTPGSYVMFCNLVVGPSSHAARGQVLSITVIE
ncbi:MAG: hypothetical protein ABL953_08190 [Ilumatobacteraceae bacterium]